MRKLRMHAGVLAGLLALSLVAAACGGDDTPSGDGGTDTGSAPPDLTGSITISGSSTVEPISSIVAEIFNETSPNVSISVDGPGTGDGFELFCSGEIDISDASRPIEDDEAKACKKAGIEYTELEVGLDGVTVMTNPENADVTCLSFGDLYALFGPESDGIDTWNGADSLAAEVGGNGGFPDAPLEITAPGEESGTYDAFIELSGIEDTAIAQGVPEDQAAALRSDYQRSPNDNVIILAMEGSPSALGFVGFAFAEQAGDQVKEIQVDGGERLRRSLRGHDLRRLLPALTLALHLREQRGDGTAGDPGLRGLLPDGRIPGDRRTAGGGGLHPPAARADRGHEVGLGVSLGMTRRNAREGAERCEPFGPIRAVERRVG